MIILRMTGMALTDLFTTRIGKKNILNSGLPSDCNFKSVSMLGDDTLEFVFDDGSDVPRVVTLKYESGLSVEHLQRHVADASLVDTIIVTR